jgi:hypothetical protein
MTDELLRMLARELAPYLREELLPGRSAASGDEWVDVADELPSRKRQLNAACRTGELEARKVARRWLSRRRNLDRWIESHASKKPKAEKKPASSYLDGARERLGLRSVG